MLADYPNVVDYNFSPLNSPLYQHNDLQQDDFFPRTPFEADTDIPLTDDIRFPSDYVPMLNDEDDDVSSISASVQLSEPLDVDDIESRREAGEDGTTSHHGNHLLDLPIPGKGEVETDGLFGSVGSDYLTSSYLHALQDSTLAENVNLDLISSVEADLELCIASNVEVDDCNNTRSKVNDPADPKPVSVQCATCVMPSTSHRPGRPKKKTEEKRWSEMSSSEREEVADHLTEVLRSLLGPRERLEVMAMITQERRSRINERDFVIDTDMLSEVTLAKLETFLEQHEMKGEASDSELISEPERKRNSGGVGSGKRRCASLPPSPQHRGSYLEDSPSIGVKKRSNQRKSLRAWRTRTRKEYRQASRERRSGLFHQEEVISLNKDIAEDDGEEEIDILE